MRVVLNNDEWANEFGGRERSRGVKHFRERETQREKKKL